MHDADKPVVLQVLPALETGGVARGTVEIADALQRNGFRAIVASSGGRYAPDLKALGVQHIQLPLHSKNPFQIHRNTKRLSQLIKAYRVNLIHARSRAPAWSAWGAAQRLGIPFLTTFHGVYGLQGGVLKKHYNSIMTRGDRVIAVSQFVADHIVSNYAVDSARIRVIHRGADVQVFNSASIDTGHTQALIHAWQIADERRPIVLIPSRLTRWKGQDFCIKALARLPRRDFLCVLLGASDQHPRFVEDLRSLIAQNALQNSVRFVGETPYMTEAYALARLVVVPSLEPEAFGRAPVEAQAMGRPVITTRHGGACETVLEDRTGWLVPTNDVQALSTTIQAALSLDENRYVQMSQNAIKNAREHFSVDAMQRKTLAVYRELLQS